VRSDDYDNSYFDWLCGEVSVRWKDEFTQRVMNEQKNNQKDRIIFDLWRKEGLPTDERGDVDRLRGISAVRMTPPEDADIVRMCKDLLPKWRKFEEVFAKIDVNGDGNVDLGEFIQGFDEMALGWSHFDLTRLFHFVSGHRAKLKLAEFNEWFAPPKPSQGNIQKLRKLWPWLLDDREEVAAGLLQRMVLTSYGEGDTIYRVGLVEDWLFIVEEGSVEVIGVDGKVARTCGPQDAFGVSEALPRFTTDAEMRQDTARAAQDCILWKLTKEHMDWVLGRMATEATRQKFYCLNPTYKASYRARTQQFAPPYPDAAVSGKARSSAFKIAGGPAEVRLGTPEHEKKNVPRNALDEINVNVKRQLDERWAGVKEPWSNLVLESSLPLIMTDGTRAKVVHKHDHGSTHAEAGRLASDRVLDFRVQGMQDPWSVIDFVNESVKSRSDRLLSLNRRCKRVVASIT